MHFGAVDFEGDFGDSAADAFDCRAGDTRSSFVVRFMVVFRLDSVIGYEYCGSSSLFSPGFVVYNCQEPEEVGYLLVPFPIGALEMEDGVPV